MVKRVHVSKMVGVKARTAFLNEIANMEASGYAINKEMQNAVKREAKRVERDNVEEFVEVDINGAKTKYSMADWFGQIEQQLKDNSKFFRTRKVNKAISMVSSGVLDSGEEFKVERI